MTILATAILSMALGQGSQSSLLRQIIPNPTGNNGFEEYLAACDIVRSPAILQPLYERPKDGAAESILSLWRQAVNKGAQALALVNRGNRKPVLDPRGKSDWQAKFPEQSHIRTLGSLLVAAAYVAFADGQSSRGTQFLADALIFGQKLCVGTVISRLNGAVIQENAIATVERLIPNISLLDADVLQKLATSLIAQKPPGLKTVENELSTPREYFGKMLAFNQEPGAYDPEQTISEVERSALAYLKRMSPAQRQQAIDLCASRIDRFRLQMIAEYRKPESQWDAITDNGKANVAPNERIDDPAQLADLICNNHTAAFTNLAKHDVRIRTQIRVLGLVCAVIRFKWEHDRLPSKLAEAAGEPATFDPASGDQFQYEVQPNGFRVYSKGTKLSGEIGLRYQSARPGQNLPPPFSP